MNRLLLLIGMGGTLIMAISDVLLLVNPVSGLDAFMRDPRNMLTISHERLALGGMLGVLLGGPLQIAGYLALYRLTRLRGGYQPMIMAGGFIYMVVMAVAAHTAYIYTGIALRTDMITGDAVAVEFISNQQNILRMILMVFNGSPLLLSSVLYMMIISRGPTTIPKWMLIVNPFMLNLVIAGIALVMPAPVGGYMALPSFNLAQLVFFTTLFVHVSRLRPGIWTNTTVS
jgi:hypothetical protein